MNTPTLLLGGVAGILALALVWQNRSAATEQAQTTGELGKFSNDWKQAVFKLDEQSRLAYTLQTQLKLIQAEHLAATNELPKVKAALSLLQSNHLWSADQAHAVSNRLQLHLLELQDERIDSDQRLQQVQRRLQDLDQSLLQATSQLAQIAKQATTFSNSWKQSELAREQTEAQLRDPVVLAAQLARVAEEAKLRVRPGQERGSGRPRLELLSDGSVKQVP